MYYEPNNYLGKENSLLEVCGKTTLVYTDVVNAYEEL